MIYQLYEIKNRLVQKISKQLPLVEVTLGIELWLR